MDSSQHDKRPIVRSLSSFLHSSFLPIKPVSRRLTGHKPPETAAQRGNDLRVEISLSLPRRKNEAIPIIHSLHFLHHLLKYRECKCHVIDFSKMVKPFLFGAHLTRTGSIGGVRQNLETQKAIFKNINEKVYSIGSIGFFEKFPCRNTL